MIRCACPKVPSVLQFRLAPLGIYAGRNGHHQAQTASAKFSVRIGLREQRGSLSSLASDHNGNGKRSSSPGLVVHSLAVWTLIAAAYISSPKLWQFCFARPYHYRFYHAVDFRDLLMMMSLCQCFSISPFKKRTQQLGATCTRQRCTLGLHVSKSVQQYMHTRAVPWFHQHICRRCAIRGLMLSLELSKRRSYS